MFNNTNKYYGPSRDQVIIKIHIWTMQSRRIYSYFIIGIPQTDEETCNYPKYFEFHIKVKRKDGQDTGSITNEEVTALKSVAVDFSKLYGVPVPLSFNKNKGIFLRQIS